MQVQHRLCPLHNHTSIESRLESATLWIHNPTIFKRILEPQWTSDLDSLYHILPRIGIPLYGISQTKLFRHTSIDGAFVISG